MSLRITQGIIFSDALRNIQSSSSRSLKVQQQVASGLRVQRPSDDPGATLRIMPLRAEIRDLESTRDVLDLSRQSLDTATQVLQDVSDVMMRLRELTLEGANSTVSASDRTTMAGEVDQLLERLLAATNSTFDERHLFGGTVADRVPFAIVEDGGGSRVVYRGGPEPLSQTVPVSLPTQFGLAGDEVFLQRDRQPTTITGTTGAASIGTGDSGVGWGELQVSFAGLTFGSGTTGVAQGSGTTPAVGDLDYVYTAGSPPTLSLNGGPAQAIAGGVQSFTVGSGETVSLDVSGAISPATGTIVSEAFLSTDGGQSTVQVTDFSGSTPYQVRNSYDGTVLNVDVSDMARVGTDSVKFEGTFDSFTALLAVRDLLENEDGLTDIEVQNRLTGMLSDVDFAHDSVLSSVQEFGDRSNNLDALSDRFDQLALARRSTLSQLEDADLAETLLAFNQQELSFRAALQVGARAMQTSLLNFLR